MKMAKLIVVGVVALFAVSIAATSAFAEGTTDEYEGTGAFSGSQSTTNVFTTHAGTVECKKAEFSGSLTGASKTVEVTPSYSECKAFGFVEATVNMEGCKYLFGTPEDVNGETTDTIHKGKVSVTCPSGKTIKVSASGCVASVGAQSNLNKVESEKEGTGLLVKSGVEKIKYTLTGLFCPNGEGTFSEGKYTGNVKVSPLAIN